jgi:hypothetical protein
VPALHQPLAFHLGKHALEYLTKRRHIGWLELALRAIGAVGVVDLLLGHHGPWHHIVGIKQPVRVSIWLVADDVC